MKSSTISLAFEVSNVLLELFLLLTDVFPNYASLLYRQLSLFRMRDDVRILEFRIVFKILKNHRMKKQVTIFFPGDVRLKIFVEQQIYNLQTSILCIETQGQLIHYICFLGLDLKLQIYISGRLHCLNGF